MCNNFKYHSSQCSNSPSASTSTTTTADATKIKPTDQSNINVIITGLIAKLEFQLGTNVNPECGQMLLTDGHSCLTTAQNKHQTSNNSRVVCNTCCGAWYVRDCVTEVGKVIISDLE